MTHLFLGVSDAYTLWSKEALGYEVGVAVGKLRRLRDLALDLSDDGRTYHAVAQGLAASGGDRPLPLLWRVVVVAAAQANADLLASLLFPSVRVFRSAPFNTQAALLSACALRQVGYKHTWAVSLLTRSREAETAVRAIAECSVEHLHMEHLFCDIDRLV
jgi:hypothetical protein